MFLQFGWSNFLVFGCTDSFDASRISGNAACFTNGFAAG
jgi:hypothetical protein